MRSFNVFHCADRDLLCAVPEDRPVPRFVTSKAWEFRGTVPEGTVHFPRATEVSVRFNGFYIFHPYEIPQELKTCGSTLSTAEQLSR